MVERRAVSREDKELQPTRLPMLYKTLAPLTPSRHGGLFLSSERSFAFASMANAIPLTVDEFPQAMRHYPIVIAGRDAPTPVALVGHQNGKCDYIDEHGQWTSGTYVPAYLRRYPFAFLKESEDSDRNVLCSDQSSIMFSNSGEPDRALFDGENPSAFLQRVLDFCNRYDVSQQRTRAMIKEATDLDLIDTGTVNISRGGQTFRVEGFNIISEEKLRNLPDDALAGLARRGILSLFTTHHLSLTNFSDFGPSI